MVDKGVGKTLFQECKLESVRRRWPGNCIIRLAAVSKLQELLRLYLHFNQALILHNPNSQGTELTSIHLYSRKYYKGKE